MSFVVVAACAEEEPTLEVSASAVTVYDEEDQGKFILGPIADGQADGLMHVHVSSIPNNRPGFTLSVTSSVAGAHLIAQGPAMYSGTATWFKGLIMNGPNGKRLKISETDNPVAITGGTAYKLLYDDGSGWRSYCKASSAGAIPLHGAYTKKRIHVPYLIGGSNAITFACAGEGVAEKCNAWGYVAGNTGPATNPQFPNDWDYHQACTAAANADYCRRGESLTRELTPILLRDFKDGAMRPPWETTETVLIQLPFGGGSVPLQMTYPRLESPDPFPGDPDTHYIEAAWRPGSKTPVCLSKLRWSSLPLDPCPPPPPSGGGPPPGTHEDPPDNGLFDPRTSQFGQSCEDFTFADLKSHGALIINASKMMDAPLYRWKNPDPQKTDVTSTIRGFHSANPADDAPPSSAYDEYVGPAGMILRNLTGVLENNPGIQLVELYGYGNGTDRYMASAAVAARIGYTARYEFEGYAFGSPMLGNTVLPPLYVCETSTGDHVTLVDPLPAGMCVKTEHLGYAMPPPE